MFETISAYNGNLVFINSHLDRLNNTLRFLGIEKTIKEKDIYEFVDAGDNSYIDFIKENEESNSNSYALKLMVSEKNNIFSVRENPYDVFDDNRTFRLQISDNMRNEKSIFVNHKTFNYGENVFLKKKAMRESFDDYLFLNSTGNVSETTTGNIFFVRSGKVFTPKVDDGILPGVMRKFVLENFQNISEKTIKFSDIEFFDEAFVTNSLMGIMPVSKLGEISFASGKITKGIKYVYLEYLRSLKKD